MGFELLVVELWVLMDLRILEKLTRSCRSGVVYLFANVCQVLLMMSNRLGDLFVKLLVGRHLAQLVITMKLPQELNYPGLGQLIRKKLRF